MVSLRRRFLSRVILLPAGFVLVAASYSDAVNLDSLLVQSVGGPEAVERLRSLSSYYATGRVSVSGQPGSFEMSFLSPDKVRSDLAIGALKIVEAYDGTVAWTQDQNGSVSEIAGYQRREVTKAVWMQSYSFIFKDRLQGGAEYLGLSERDGRMYHVVALYPFDEDTLRLYLDSATARAEIAIDRTDNLESVTKYEDYRLVEGVREPFHVVTVLTEAGVTIDYRVEQIRYDSSIAPAIFTKPGESVPDYRFPPECDSVHVPFASDGGHIYVPVTINGTKKLRFILDSGSSANVIDATAVGDISLPEAGRVPVRGVGGYESAALVRTDSLTIGNLVLLAQVAAMMDMSLIGSSPVADEPFGGILGYDFLSRFPVLVDFDNNTLTVYDPKTFKAAEGGVEIPFFLTSRVPTIRATLEGVPGDFIVDLGNSSDLLVHSEFLAVNGIVDRLRDVTGETSGTVGGVGGEVAGRKAVASEFTFGGISLSNVPVRLAATSAGLSGSTELAGNIGLKILREYRVLFDYSGSRLILYAKPAVGY
jgi:hypothetical protein